MCLRGKELVIKMKKDSMLIKVDLSKMNDSLRKELLSSENEKAIDSDTEEQDNINILEYEISENNLNFDEKTFKELLNNSIIFSDREKIAMLDRIPQLSQHQLDEIIKVLQFAEKRFESMDKQFSEELEKIKK